MDLIILVIKTLVVLLVGIVLASIKIMAAVAFTMLIVIVVPFLLLLPFVVVLVRSQNRCPKGGQHDWRLTRVDADLLSSQNSNRDRFEPRDICTKCKIIH